MSMKGRNAEHIKPGDGVLWCGNWLTVTKVRHLPPLRSGRVYVDLWMGSDEIPPCVYHYTAGEKVMSSVRKNRKRRKARRAMALESHRASAAGEPR